MTQIAKKWIQDRAIDHTKLDSSDSYSMQGLAIHNGLGTITLTIDSNGNINAASISTLQDETNRGNIAIVKTTPIASSWHIEAGYNIPGDFQLRKDGAPALLYLDGNASHVSIGGGVNTGDITGSGNIRVNSDATVGGGLSVGSSASIGTSLGVGDGLDVGGDATITGGLDVQGSLNVSGSIAFPGTLVVDHIQAIDGTFSTNVQIDSSIVLGPYGQVISGDDWGNVAVQNDLVVGTHGGKGIYLSGDNGNINRIYSGPIGTSSDTYLYFAANQGSAGYLYSQVANSQINVNDFAMFSTKHPESFADLATPPLGTDLLSSVVLTYTPMAPTVLVLIEFPSFIVHELYEGSDYSLDIYTGVITFFTTRPYDAFYAILTYFYYYDQFSCTLRNSYFAPSDPYLDKVLTVRGNSWFEGEVDATTIRTYGSSFFNDLNVGTYLPSGSYKVEVRADANDGFDGMYVYGLNAANGVVGVSYGNSGVIARTVGSGGQGLHAIAEEYGTDAVFAENYAGGIAGRFKGDINQESVEIYSTDLATGNGPFSPGTMVLNTYNAPVSYSFSCVATIYNPGPIATLYEYSDFDVNHDTGEITFYSSPFPAGTETIQFEYTYVNYNSINTPRISVYSGWSNRNGIDIYTYVEDEYHYGLRVNTINTTDYNKGYGPAISANGDASIVGNISVTSGYMTDSGKLTVGDGVVSDSYQLTVATCSSSGIQRNGIFTGSAGYGSGLDVTSENGNAIRCEAIGDSGTAIYAVADSAVNGDALIAINYDDGRAGRFFGSVDIYNGGHTALYVGSGGVRFDEGVNFSTGGQGPAISYEVIDVLNGWYARDSVGHHFTVPTTIPVSSYIVASQFSYDATQTGYAFPYRRIAPDDKDASYSATTMSHFLAHHIEFYPNGSTYNANLIIYQNSEDATGPGCLNKKLFITYVV